MLGRPENAAEEMLKATWLDEDGDISLPVNVEAIAKRLGLKFYVADLGQDVSGMLVKQPGRDVEVHVNQSHGEARKRFTGAHELGHYVMRSGEDPATTEENWGYVELRDPLSATGDEPHEVWANQFAAALLMPRDQVTRLHAEVFELAILAAKFGVSPEAMAYRLRGLGLR